MAQLQEIGWVTEIVCRWLGVPTRVPVARTARAHPMQLPFAHPSRAHVAVQHAPDCSAVGPPYHHNLAGSNLLTRIACVLQLPHPCRTPCRTPEIQRTSLVRAVLYLKSLQLGIDVLAFDFLDPPAPEALEVCAGSGSRGHRSILQCED